MKPYNVEIFDTDFNMKSHTNIDTLKHKADYLDPEQNTVEIISPFNMGLNDYIRIFGNGKEIWGVITKIEQGSKDEKQITKATYKDIMGFMDIDMVIDTALIGDGSIEEYIAARIREVHENNDIGQPIATMTFIVETETNDWTLDIEAEEGMTKTSVNLFDDIIAPAFKKYDVKVDFKVSPAGVICTITKNDNLPVIIETHLPNVLSKIIRYKAAKKEINKDRIYNKKDFSVFRTYYLHPDGTHDTSDTDTLSPVSFKLETVSTKTAEEWKEKYEKTLNSAIKTVKSCQSKLDKGETLDEATLTKERQAVTDLNTVDGITLTIDSFGRVTGFDEELCQNAVDEYILTEEYEERCTDFAWDEFTAKADAKADKTFASNKYENNIELEFLNDDSLIRPNEMEIGQILRIYDEGSEYETVLSGKETGETTTLICGNSRIELTKILKGRS